MKKYIIFVDNCWNTKCDTIKEAKEFVDNILKVNKKSLKEWKDQLKKLESMKHNSFALKLTEDVKNNISCIEETIKGIKNNTYIYKIIK